MLKRTGFILLLSIISVNLKAVDLDQLTWFNGEIYLMDGTWLQGKVSYSVNSDVVKINDDGRIKAFSPVKVNHFSFYDDIYEMNRTFYALPHQDKQYPKIVFFELIHEGEVALLSRLSLLHVNQKIYVDTPIILESEIPDWARMDNYYIMKRNGEMHNFNGTTTSLLEILQHQKPVKEFIKSEQIDLRDRGDLSLLMNFYDTFFQT